MDALLNDTNELMGERMRMLVAKHRLSLRSLSARTGVNIATLSKLSRGQIGDRTAYKTLRAVADALGITVGQLIGESPLDYSLVPMAVGNLGKLSKP